jgi:hypothetical protein
MPFNFLMSPFKTTRNYWKWTTLSKNRLKIFNRTWRKRSLQNTETNWNKSKFFVFSFTKQTETKPKQNRNRSCFGLVRFEPKFIFVCFEDTQYWTYSENKQKPFKCIRRMCRSNLPYSSHTLADFRPNPKIFQILDPTGYPATVQFLAVRVRVNRYLWHRHLLLSKPCLMTAFLFKMTRHIASHFIPQEKNSIFNGSLYSGSFHTMCHIVSVECRSKRLISYKCWYSTSKP